MCEQKRDTKKVSRVSIAHLDLRVREEKHDGFVFDSCFLHHLLQVVTPLSDTVVLGQLDLEALKVNHVRSQPGHALPTRPTHAEEEGVAHGLANDATDLGCVLHSVVEQHEAHLGRVGLVGST
jgi:hypothetical protein